MRRIESVHLCILEQKKKSPSCCLCVFFLLAVEKAYTCVLYMIKRLWVDVHVYKQKFRCLFLKDKNVDKLQSLLVCPF